MSEVDFVEATDDSFWEVGQYKRTVKRCEDGYKLCNDFMQMVAERAEIEKTYSKNLKSWAKKWNDYLHKGNEYGTMKSTWMAALNEADKLSEIHLTTHNVLIDELNTEMKTWQKENYLKSIVNQLKIAKEYEEEFKKVQKPWAKKHALVDKTKKDYHNACKSFQTARVQFSNSQNDSAISSDQKKKLEDKVEKYRKEVEICKNKYKHALDDLNSYNSRYIEDMNAVYKKCDQFEKKRLDFFIEKFQKLQNHLNIYEKMNVEEIYTEFLRVVKQANPEKDLLNWSKDCGNNMAMNWPVFEEYSEELKTIAKGTRATKMVKDINSDNNGVTMTSIRHKVDDSSSDKGSLNHMDINNRRRRPSPPQHAVVPKARLSRASTISSSTSSTAYVSLPPPPPIPTHSHNHQLNQQHHDHDRQQLKQQQQRIKYTLPQTKFKSNRDSSSSLSLSSSSSEANLSPVSKNRFQHRRHFVTTTNTLLSSNATNTFSSSSASTNLNTSNSNTNKKSNFDYYRSTRTLTPSNKSFISRRLSKNFSSFSSKLTSRLGSSRNSGSTRSRQSIMNTRDNSSGDDNRSQLSSSRNLDVATNLDKLPASHDTKSMSSLKKQPVDDYPVERNPFGDDDNDDNDDDDEFSDDDCIASNDTSSKTTPTSQSLSSSLAKPESTATPKAAQRRHLNTKKNCVENDSKINTSNHHSNSNNSKESNPFGDDEDDDSNHNHTSSNHHSHSLNNDDSDDDGMMAPKSYLNVKVRALYDYQSAEDDELSFKAGEEFIKLAEEDDRGWCMGKIGDKIGLYPATYAANV